MSAPLRLAFAIYRYFPHGGRERNCEATARLCASRGHDVHVFTRAWDGPRPAELAIHELGQRGLTNSSRDARFLGALRKHLDREHFDLVVGFDRVPGCDVFYAADPAIALDVSTRSLASRLTLRTRRQLGWERALVSPPNRGGADALLVLTEARGREFLTAYPELDAERVEVLPPNLDDTPLRQPDEGARLLAEHGVRDEHRVVLFVGSDYSRKGLDRVLEALPHWPANTRLVVAGADDARPFLARARALNVEPHVLFLGPRDDVAALQARADLLVHPARKETAGIVLLEALRHGTPVVATGTCGFADHVRTADAGIVLEEPFEAAAFRDAVLALLDDEEARLRLARNGRSYAQRPELYGRQQHIAACLEALVRRRKRDALAPSGALEREDPQPSQGRHLESER